MEMRLKRGQHSRLRKAEISVAASDLAGRQIEIGHVAHVLRESHVLRNDTFRKQLQAERYADCSHLAVGMEMQIKMNLRAGPNQAPGILGKDVGVLANGVFIQE